MKTSFIFSLLAAVCFSFSVGAAPLKTGDILPASTAFTDHMGKAHTLGELKGKVVVFEWANYQCPFTRKHYDSGNMPRLQAETLGKGALWYTVISSGEGKQGYISPKDAPGEVARQGFKGTGVILDSQGVIGHLFGAESTPEIFVVGTDGRLAYAGAVDNIPSFSPEDVAKATPYATPAVDALLAGKTAPVAQTKTYGCSVKYAP